MRNPCMHISAISLDLDDTLWPIVPTIARAEQILHAWFEAEHPQVAAAFPVSEMRALRDRIWAENPGLRHDFTATRLMSLRAAMLPNGATEADVQIAFTIFYDARNEVTLFPGTLSALKRLAERWPIVALSNGTADLQRIGLAEYFRARMDARSFGMAKPAREIFLAAAAALDRRPEHMLHIGDDAYQDVFGALNAGMQAAWISDANSVWPFEIAPPPLRATSFSALCETLLASH
jgi:FMN hydrolase / 5-amino-6-(5-phospho-D-ribitylamino)uracil phosphatase